ncbi:hypothetical protein FN976_11170 [Caenimonas sedimenti]|uniref:Uncharacterized domain-containing protein n=1 Tax=Caenimonas sedimenti TaxID=2596921 RepID=A0A562ZSA1_9BURK|nr:TraI domain-containing protein [Caenimonas sedimenti]TWO71469.1 hypothetical protein FN976_11170 [Caenimonas sedimenti]
MTLQWLRKLVGLTPAQHPPSSPQRVAPPIQAAIPATALRYPPADPGLKILDPDAILVANEDLVRRLRLHAAAAEHDFEQRFIEPLKRLAVHINALPATSTSLFSGEMGLFRAALECAFFAFQSSDGRIFTGSEGVERRHELESRWRYLCFLVGMFYPLGKPLERLVVTSEAGASWPRHFKGLTQWASDGGLDRVFVSWATVDDTEQIGPGTAGLALLPNIVGSVNLQHLENGAADLVASLYDLASGAPGRSLIAQQVVVGCWTKIMVREHARRPQAFGRVVAGTHQGPYLAGALRALVEARTWVPDRSPLFVDQNGVYLRWPEAAADLIRYGQDRDYAGWPTEAATVAKLLRAAELVTGSGSDVGIVEVVSDDGEIWSALKVVNPLAVLEDFDSADYRRETGRTLEAVIAADPLAAAAQAPAPPAPRPSSTAPAAREPKSRAAAQVREPVEPIQVDDEAPAPAEPPKTGEVSSPVTVPEPTRPLREAPDIRYADLVPEDVQNTLGNSLHVELLGKVVKAWRERGEHSKTMRRVDEGAAISFDFLTSNIRDVPTWVEAMGRAGFINTPAQTPGLKVQKVSIPEGGSKVQAVVLSNLACKRLQL